MKKITFHNYCLLLYCSLYVFLFTADKCFAQDKIIQGKVFAFKNSELQNIKVTAQKSKEVAFTKSDGTFSIVCKKKDKLVFRGNGFQKTSQRVNHRNAIEIKMLLKENAANKEKAIHANHISNEALEFSLVYFSRYNYDPTQLTQKSRFYYNRHLKRDQAFYRDFYKKSSISPSYYTNISNNSYVHSTNKW